MKESKSLRSAAEDFAVELNELTKDNLVDYAVVYGDFIYKADILLYLRCIVCKVEKPYGQLTHIYTFIVPNIESIPEAVIHFYYKPSILKI